MTWRWEGLDPLAGFTLMTTPTWDSERAFRFRNDDGSQTTATWKAAQNTTISQLVGANFRLRVESQMTNAGDTTAVAWTLQYRIDGGTWTTATDATAVRYVTSSFVSNGTATTNQLTAGTGTFVAGYVMTSANPTSTNSMVASTHTENEWNLRLVGVDNGATVEFRVLVNDTAQTGTTTPSLTATSADRHGDVASTEGADTAAIAGTVVDPPTSGTVAAAEGSDTGAVSGTSAAPSFSGTVVAADGDDAGAVAGTSAAPGEVFGLGSPVRHIEVVASETFSGAVAASEGGDVGVVAGAHTPPTFSGAVAASEGGDVGVLAGTSTPPTFSGAVASTEQPDAGAVVGTSTPPEGAGYVLTAEQPDVGAASGVYTPPARSGTVAAAEQDDAGAVVGAAVAPTYLGTVSAAETADTAVVAGAHEAPTFTGTVSVTEGDDQGVLAGASAPPEGSAYVLAAEQPDVGSLVGTFTPPVRSGTVAVTESGDGAAVAGAHVPPTFSATVTVTEGGDVGVAAGTFTVPTFTGAVDVTEVPDVASVVGTAALPAVVGAVTATEDDDVGRVRPPLEWRPGPSGFTGWVVPVRTGVIDLLARSFADSTVGRSFVTWAPSARHTEVGVTDRQFSRITVGRTFARSDHPARFTDILAPDRFIELAYVHLEDPAMAVVLEPVIFAPLTVNHVPRRLWLRVLEVKTVDGVVQYDQQGNAQTDPVPLYADGWQGKAVIVPPTGAPIGPRDVTVPDPATLPNLEPQHFTSAPIGWSYLEFEDGDFAEASPAMPAGDTSSWALADLTSHYRIQAAYRNLAGTVLEKATSVVVPIVHDGPTADLTLANWM
jgi:hypothetical protein